MIDRTELEQRIAAHHAQTAGVNQGEWQRQGTTRRATTARQSRRMVGVVALGLGLLAGVLFGRASAAAPVALPSAEYARADGGSAMVVANSRALYDGYNPGFLGPDAGEATIFAAPGTPPGTRIWAGLCRAGSSDCLPDEDPLEDAPIPAATESPFVPGQFTYRENRRAYP